MANPRHYRPFLMSLALGAMVVGAFPLAAQASSKGATPTTVLAAAKASLAKQTGVHIEVHSKAGKLSSSVVVDIGQTQGQEHITSGLETINIVLTSATAFLSGSATGLTAIMGLTAAQQKIVGTKSISMKPGTTPYTNFHSNLTTPALISMLPVAKGTSLSSKVINGVKYQLLSWTTKATTTTQQTKSVLTLTSTSPILPVSEKITSPTGGGTTAFSKWGEKFSVSVPPASSTVSYTKIFG